MSNLWSSCAACALALLPGFVGAQSPASPDEPAGAHAQGRSEDAPGVLVEGPRAASADEISAAHETILILITPMTLAELAAPAPGMNVSAGSDGFSMPMRSVARDDGVTLTVLGAGKGDGPPSNVGVWHGSGGGGLGAILGGTVGKLVLRVHAPDSNAKPFGFRRVRLFEDGVETAFAFTDGEWQMRRYEGAEE